MAEITRIEIDHIKEDISKIECKVSQQETDTKAQFKEQSIAISAIRDSNYKMEFLVNHIIQSQTDMVEQNKETAKENKETNKTILDTLSDIQNAPFVAWKNMNGFIKFGIVSLLITLIGTYLYGTFMSFFVSH